MEKTLTWKIRRQDIVPFLEGKMSHADIVAAIAPNQEHEPLALLVVNLACPKDLRPLLKLALTFPLGLVFSTENGSIIKWSKPYYKQGRVLPSGPVRYWIDSEGLQAWADSLKPVRS